MAYLQPTTEAGLWIIPEIELSGVTQLGDATGISNDLTAIIGEGEAAFLAAAQDSPTVVGYRPLPAAGTELQAGEIYGYASGLVIVRQSHTRTEHAPADVPALFSVYRAGGGTQDWIANEPVQVGTIRTYGGKTYRCVQAHTTQTDWTPDKTPALWAEYNPNPQPGEWAVGVAYKVGDMVTYQSKQYRCLQAHTSQAGWTPTAVPALWQVVP